MFQHSENFELSVEEAENVAKMGLEDPGFFLRTFFPRWFPLPMPWIHRGILALLSNQTDWLLKFGEEEWPKARGVWDEKQLGKIIRHFVWRPEPDNPNSPVVPIFTLERDNAGHPVALHMGITDRMLVIAPRGISKTTLVNGSNIRRISYHDSEFLVYLSETATHAEQQLENVKRELESNYLLRAVFGNKRPDRSDPARWTQSLIETTDGMVITAKGRGGQVRGLNHRGKRPQDIVFDDVEDRESVKTEDQRDKSISWLKADVEPALPQIDGEGGRGRIIGLGTILHHDSLLIKLSRDPEWVTVRFGAVDAEGDMIWDHYMNKESFTRKRRSFIRLGKLSDFNREFQSSTRSEGDGAKFANTCIRYDFIDPKIIKEEFPVRALVQDPAISDKKDSDYCAFAVVGMSKKGRVHVIDMFMEVGMHPRAQVDKFFELHFLWDCTKHGIEAVAFQKALIHLMREEQFRKAKSMGPSSYFEIEPIMHGRTSKVERVEGILAPRYAAGYVTHQRRFPELEEQLLDWPNAKMDGPDVVAMAVQLLDPFAALAFEVDIDAEGNEVDRLAGDSMPPLDEIMDGEWRQAP